MEQFRIRAVREDEFPTVFALSCAAFGEHDTGEDEQAHRLGFPFDRALAAFDGDKMVATSAVYSQELTLPGGVTIPMGGLTWIATLPTYRRQGLLTQLVSAQFADMKERGEAVSGLVASEGTIYGRFGYGPATSIMGFSVERAYSAFSTPLEAGAPGHFELLEAAEAAVRLPPIYDGLRLRVPGTISRPTTFWSGYLADPPSERGGGTRMFHVVHETSPGRADGYVSYRIKEDWKGATACNTAHVVELLAEDPATYAALWRYVLDTDLTCRISCGRGRVDEPLRWLLAESRRFTVGQLSDFLWLRLLDVPRALAARRYSTPGRLVIEVDDPFPTPLTQRFLLSVEGSVGPYLPAAPSLPAECTPSTAPPDLALGVDALSALYLGGVTFATMAAAGRVRELTPGALARADSMFSGGAAPFCATEF